MNRAVSRGWNCVAVTALLGGTVYMLGVVPRTPLQGMYRITKDSGFASPLIQIAG